MIRRALSWPWLDHSVSGLLAATVRPIRTRFRFGFGPEVLNLATTSNSPAHYAKGTPSPRASSRLRPLVSIRFQVLFHSPSGVLFTFPSRYLFTIGRRVVFSLGGWSPQLPTGFHVSRSTREFVPRSRFSFVYRTITLSGRPFHASSTRESVFDFSAEPSSARTNPTTPITQR